MAVTYSCSMTHLVAGTSSSSSFRYAHFPSRPLLAQTNPKVSPHRLVLASSSSSPKEEQLVLGIPQATNAADAVNLGLELFSKGRVYIYVLKMLTSSLLTSNERKEKVLEESPKSFVAMMREALAQFDAALTLNPDPEEAKAALYNKACCHAYREEGEKAAEALRRALKDYGLKFSVILNDPDMAPLRAMPEFKQLQDEARKGGQEIGDGFRRDLKLIGEVQAPFRGVRKFFYVAFTAAAGISLFFTIPRLFGAIQGGLNAPDLWGTVQNAGIDVGGVVIFISLFIWETKKEEEQIAKISRDETLSRLPLRLSTDRIVELVQLRETARPVILAGKKDTVTRAVQRAEKFRSDLLKRGVILIPFIWNDNKVEPVRKKGFGGLKRIASPPTVDFEKRVQEVAAKTVVKAERRFKAEIVSPIEWERWVREQQEAEGVTPGEDVYIVLRLDGRVRKSGVGMPYWEDLVNELPPLDALISKLER